MRRSLARLANLFHRRSAEREMNREIDSHLALIAEEFERAGMSPREAALAARRAYGGVEQSKELHRDARTFVGFEQLLKDIHYAWRNLLRNPGFTLLAVLALALGIGANATIFGLYNAAALKQLPVAGASRVVRIRRWASHIFKPYDFAYTEYQNLRDRNSMFAGVVAASSAIPAMARFGGTAPEHVRGYAVSANYFSVLGVKARIGRTFLPEDDRTAGGNAVVVLSYACWQRKSEGESNVLGRTIQLNGTAYTVVGVAPPDFTGTDVFPGDAAFWAPLSMIEQLHPAFGAGWHEQWRDTADYPGFQLLARLQDGVARTAAQAETDLLIRRYLTGYRESRPTTAITLQRTSYFGGAGDFGVQAFAAAVWLMVSLVLVVACANVANMLLARGAARQREIGVRLALGAGRGRVVRQLLAESILLSLLGGAAGLLVAGWAGTLLWTSLTGFVQGFRDLHMELNVSPDSHVLIYGLVISLATGIFSGLAPALRSTRPDLHRMVNGEDWSLGMGLGRSRLRGALLAAQVTVSVLLLVVSARLMGGLVSSYSRSSELGFETHHAYRVSGANEGVAETRQRLRDRLEKLPELSSASIGGAPLREVFDAVHVAAGNRTAQTALSFASDGYFQTLGIRLLRGRGFTRRESDSGAPVAVISEATARRLWPGYPSGQDALGSYLALDAKFTKVDNYQVIGIVKDVRFVSLTRFDAAHVYLPPGAALRLLGGLMVGIRGNRDKAVAAIESAVEAEDPSLLPTLDVVSLEEGPVALQRGFYRVLGAFAASLTLLSLTLASIGIYGVMAFLVSRRTREIGIRMAMGASARRVLSGVVMQGLRPVFLGMAAGLLAAAWLFRLLQSQPWGSGLLFQSRWIDPAVFAALALVLAVAGLACLIPARRALRVDPAIALRHD